MRGGKGAAQDKRRLGDQLRDAGKFADAAEAYGAYVAECPDDFDIWVQRGNCLKDSTSYQAAAMAYERAIQIKPDDADVHLQMGHLMKLRGMHDAAVDAYARALELNPRMAAARFELSTLGASLETSAVLQVPRRYVDLSDVFFYIRHHATLSGIQRVQIGIAEALIAAGAIEDEYEFVTAGRGGGYLTVEPRLVQSLIRTLASARVEIDQLRAASERASSEGEIVVPGSGDTVIVLGAFWVMENVVEQLVAMKRRGARVVILIHDIIPITHPEFCETDLTDTFNMYVNAVMRVVDLALFISDASRFAVAKTLELRGIPSPLMRVLPNAHLTWKKNTSRAAPLSDRVQDVLESPYVLYVSTIEVRKNHILLFRIWKRLLEDKGYDSIPNLVFVGRPGWRVRDLMDQIESTKRLSGKIMILHDISDMELQALYERSLFTAFTSFVEGWGLPVGESLVFGRPCIASEVSSIPEVAGDLVDYVDPHSLDTAYRVFLRMIEDERYRESRAERITREFTPRTWGDVAADLRSILAESLPMDRSKMPVLSPPRADVGAPMLAPGELHQIGHKDDRNRYVNNGLGPLVNLLFDVNWYGVENFGRWMKNRRGEIIFRVSGDTEDDFVVYLELCGVSWYAGNTVVLTVNGAKHEVMGLKPNRPLFVKVPTKAKDGCISVGFRVIGDLAVGPDPRKDLCIGLNAVAYAAASDPIARQDIFEEMFFAQTKSLKNNQISSR